MDITMILTKEKYLSQRGRIHHIFQEVLKEIFTNAFSREETVLHSFYLERSDSSNCVYFDDQPLSEKEIADPANNIRDCFSIQKYLAEKVDFQENIYRSTETISLNGSLRKVYWTLSSECLDSHHGILILNCLLQQLTNRFSQFVDLDSGRWQSMNERERANDSSIQATEIIRAIEAEIDSHLQIMFKPLQIDWVSILSGEYYERSECQSNIIFLPYDIEQIWEPKDWVYYFEEIPFLPRNSRLIRKWLQMARDDMYLVLWPDKMRKVFNIHGICNIVNLEKKLQNPGMSKFLYLKVSIRKHMLWDLFLNEQYIFTFRNGHYKIERKIQERYLCRKLTIYFGEQADNYKMLISNIVQATSQDHGTILIIMKPSDAEKEAARLGSLKYGFAESNPKNQMEAIKYLSSIDGSVIIDTNGAIHGIGVILDGLSSKAGEPERGARFNSVKKYPDALSRLYCPESVKGLAVIISDDGFIDILPVQS